jgi:D-hydroxyproline dehydrogenase subunit gamma
MFSHRTGSMFARLPDDSVAAVAITIDGVPFTAHSGDTAAAALLAAGIVACRTTPVGGVPRGPYCMMGVCFDCLVEIDGLPNVRACMTRVTPDMRIVTRRVDSKAP